MGFVAGGQNSENKSDGYSDPWVKFRLSIVMYRRYRRGEPEAFWFIGEWCIMYAGLFCFGAFLAAFFILTPIAHH